MSIETKHVGVDQREGALFDEAELPVPAKRQSDVIIKVGAPRLMTPQRDQIELRACDLDSLLGSDHAARTVWAFVQSLDLAPLHARIRSLQGSAGRPAIDPAILVALWLWATVDGVGSAREVDRLCERDNAYRWLCGGVGVNHHTLADFRTEHTAWLDAQLTRSIASLLERRLVSLNVVAQDGLRGPSVHARILWLWFGRPGIVRKLIPAWSTFFLPGFHPWNHDDRHLIKLVDSDYADARLPEALAA